MVSKDTIEMMKKIYKTEKHDGLTYSLDRAFICSEVKLSNGTRCSYTELLNYNRISYIPARDDQDASIDTLNFCFAKPGDKIEVISYPNISNIHLNFANLEKAIFGGNKKYNLVIHNDHKKRIISIARHINSMFNDFKYTNDFKTFLSNNCDYIKSIKFINISPFTLPTLNQMCQHFGIDTFKKTSLSNSFISNKLKTSLHSNNKDNETDILHK